MERFKGKPFALLGVNSDEDREALKKILIEHQITWRSWWDQRIDGPIHSKWQIELRPSIHLLDHKGVIRHKDIPPEKVDAAIDVLVKAAEQDR